MRGASAPPMAPLLPAPDYCAFKPIFPNQAAQEGGPRWREPSGGISVQLCPQVLGRREWPSRAQRSVGTVLSAPTCAPQISAFLSANVGVKQTGHRDVTKMRSRLFEMNLASGPRGLDSHSASLCLSEP